MEARELVKVEDRDKVLPRAAAEAEEELAKAKEGAWAEEQVKAWAANVFAPNVDTGSNIREARNASI